MSLSQIRGCVVLSLDPLAVFPLSIIRGSSKKLSVVLTLSKEKKNLLILSLILDSFFSLSSRKGLFDLTVGLSIFFFGKCVCPLSKEALLLSLSEGIDWWRGLWVSSRRSSEGSFFFPAADFEREAAIKMHTQLELREGGDEHPSESRGVLVSIFFWRSYFC